MKIVFITPEFPTVSETPILNQIIGLMDLGHKVDIISLIKGNNKLMHPDVQKYGLIARTTYLWDQSSTIFERMLFLATMLIRKRQYDIIYCQSGRQGLKLLLFHRLHLLSGKLVVQFRGHDISEFVNLNGNGVYKSLFQHADYFLPVCNYFRKRAISLGCPENKIRVMRQGIDCSRFKFTERRKPVRGPVKIVFAGRLVEKKGVEYAIHALSLLRERGYNVELMIVGDGLLKRKLQHLCWDLKIKKFVNFLGEKNQTQIIKILNKSHLFIAPSMTSKSGDQEGIPSVIKEAMASGLPVVSTRHSGIPELVKDGVSGFLVKEGDAKELVDRLSFLIEHPQLWPEMGKAGRLIVEKNYNNKKLIRQLADIFNHLIEEKKSAHLYHVV